MSMPAISMILGWSRASPCRFRPRLSTDDDALGVRPPLAQVAGQLAQQVICRAVVGLPLLPEASGHRTKGHRRPDGAWHWPRATD